ncbi:MAG: hypothetical protein J7L31_02410 [Thermoplasmata archaeon]|nr:hypothetical protein [Thermoplasmata archaeon]
MFRLLLSITVAISLILPLISYRYFLQIMRLMRIRRANLLVAGAVMLVTGYIFFLLPWIFIENDVPAIRLFSYYLVTAGIAVLAYGVYRIYNDWKEVVK